MIPYQKQSIWYLFKKNWHYNTIYFFLSLVNTAIHSFDYYALGNWVGSIAEYASNKNDPAIKYTFQFWTIVGSISLITTTCFWPWVNRYRAFLKVRNTQLLSKLIVTKISGLDYQKFNEKTTGNYLAWYQNDFYLIKEDFLNGLYDLLDYVLFVFFIFITLFVTSWIMALIILAMFWIFNLLPLTFNKTLQKISLKRSQITEEILGRLLKVLELWSFFSLNNLKKKFYQLFFQNYSAKEEENLKYSWLNLPYRVFSQTLFIIGINLTFVFAVILKQHNLIAISVMTTTILLSSNILRHGMGGISWVLKFNSIKKVYNKLFDTPNSLIDPQQVVNKITPFKQLIISNLAYQYHNQQDKIIKDFNYQFDRGKKYLIMAPSGYGKSTLIKIMTGLFKDYQGQVLWNGQQELKFINDYLLRNHISYVDNNNYILEDQSFETNITLWSTFNQKRFDQIVLLLKISDLKNNFDQKKNALSEGEKQKIAIARMLYQNKPIIFLDEALDNIDQQYQKHLIKVFQHFANWKTLIVVSHNIKKENRLIFDQVIHLDQIGG